MTSDLSRTDAGVASSNSATLTMPGRFRKNGVSTIELPFQDGIMKSGLMENTILGGVLGTMASFTAQTAGCDFLSADPVQREIQVREKYWGEILDRTVSSQNIQSKLKRDSSYLAAGVTSTMDKRFFSSEFLASKPDDFGLKSKSVDCWDDSCSGTNVCSSTCSINGV